MLRSRAPRSCLRGYASITSTGLLNSASPRQTESVSPSARVSPWAKGDPSTKSEERRQEVFAHRQEKQSFKITRWPSLKALESVREELVEKLGSSTVTEYELGAYFAGLLEYGRYQDVLETWNEWKMKLKSASGNARLTTVRDVVFISYVKTRLDADPTRTTNDLDFEEILELFSPMRQPKSATVQSTCIALHTSQTITKLCYDQAFRLEELSLKPNSSEFLSGANNLFIRFRADEAWDLYDRSMRHKTALNLESYTRFIIGFFGVDKTDLAIHVWNDMQRAGFVPKADAWNAVLDSAGRKKSLEMIEDVWDKIESCRVEKDVILLTTLMEALFKCGQVTRALGIFQHMSRSDNLRPNSVSCNVVIKGLVNAGDLDLAKEFLREALAAGMIPDAISFNTLFKSHLTKGDYAGASSIIKQMDAVGVEKDVATYVILIENVLRRSRGPTGMVEVRNIMQQMKTKGVKANAYVYSTILQHVLKSSRDRIDRKYGTESVPTQEAMFEAEGLLKEMVDEKVNRTVAIYNKMLHGYMLRLDVPRAVDLWNRMRRDRVQPDASVWNTMIEGYVASDMVEAAWSVFEKMTRLGVLPKKQTYSYLLNGCAARNLKDLAETVMQRMCETQFVVDSDGLRESLRRVKMSGASIPTPLLQYVL